MVLERSGWETAMKKGIGGLALLAFLSIATGCGYLGSARPIDPADFDREPGWVAVRDLKFQKQKSENDCGAATVAMVLTHWGLPSTPEDVMAGCPTSKEGMKAGDLRDLIKSRGLKGFLIHGNFDDLKTELTAGRPVIVGLVKPYVNGVGLAHYEVVMAINPEQKRLATFDPAKGPRQNTFEGFLLEWEAARSLTIVVIGTEREGSRPPDPRTHLALSPLMAAPDPDGKFNFPSGSRRPPNSRNAGTQTVSIQ
jgi:predicted double-glycine peptidase